MYGVRIYFLGHSRNLQWKKKVKKHCSITFNTICYGFFYLDQRILNFLFIKYDWSLERLLKEKFLYRQRERERKEKEKSTRIVIKKYISNWKEIERWYLNEENLDFHLFNLRFFIKYLLYINNFSLLNSLKQHFFSIN